MTTQTAKFLLNQKHQYTVQRLNSLKSTQAVQNFGSVSKSVVNQHYIGLDYMTQAWSWNKTRTWKNLIWCLSAGKTQNYTVQENINLYWRYTECSFCANECCLDPCFSKQRLVIPRGVGFSTFCGVNHHLPLINNDLNRNLMRI